MSVAGGGIARAFRGPKVANYTPDYQSIINSDPAFQAIKQGISAQGIADASQRGAATNQALIQFGSVPNFAAEQESRRTQASGGGNAYYSIDARGTDPNLVEQRVRQALVQVHKSAISTSVQANAERVKRTPG